MMTIEEVVRQVVEEVLKRSPSRFGDRVVILGKPDDENVAVLQRQLGDGIEVSIGTDLTSASRVIIPLLSCTQMADLAVGRATNYRFQQVLIRLLGGQAVEGLNLSINVSLTRHRNHYAVYTKPIGRH